MLKLVTDMLLGIISFFLIILGLGIGIISFLIVYLPWIDAFIPSLAKFIPGINTWKSLEKSFFGKHSDFNFCKRFLFGVIGAILSFAIITFPIVFYSDIRIYLFLFSVDIFFGVCGLAYYRIFMCYPRR